MRLFAVAPTAPFLPVFIEALRTGRFGPDLTLGDDPLSNAGFTILTPSRRAARAAEAAVLQTLGGRAAILPRIRAIPDVDEAELHFSDVGAHGLEDLPPALSSLDRMFVLMAFVRALAAARSGEGDESSELRALPSEAAHLAGALGNLFDTVASEEGDLARLDRFLPEEFDRYWQESAVFLDTVRSLWPAELARRGVLDPVERRRRLIEAETERIASGAAGPILAVAPPSAPPYVARLLAAVARRPDGAVVFAGLDNDLDERCWRAIPGRSAEVPPASTHAQFGLARLLGALKIERSDVTFLHPTAAARRARLRAEVLSESLLPAAATDLWGGLPERRDVASWPQALADVTLVEARGEGEEAAAVALILKQAIATPGKTAALVTPDRVIARRVAAELRRFGLTIDDSAGVPLARTPPALLSALLIEAAVAELAPVPLLALLKHPLATFGTSRSETRAAARLLERLVLRGPRPSPGSAGLHEALERLPARLEEQRIEVAAGDFENISRLIEAVAETMRPLEEIAASGPVPFADLLEAHRFAIETATAGPESGAFFSGENGEALAQFLSDLDRADHARLTLSLGDYPALLGALMSDRMVRPRAPSHPRLHIWGLREARLQHVDRIVLAGLNEGVWPPGAEADPWINRPMRRAVGLPQPEESAGAAAHDFACAFASDEVFLVRALRSGGAPTVASRLLSRLEAVIGPDLGKTLRERGQIWRDGAAMLDQPDQVKPITRPCPKPPVSARPQRLSVTEIETWLRDPYSIYARHVLGLRPLATLDERPTSERGTAVHEVLAQFAASPFAGRDDEEALAEFLAMGRARFADLLRHPPFATFWHPRFEAIGRWVVGFEAERRPEIEEVLSESSARVSIPGPAFTFKLVGRADRIERRRDGGFAVLDYKTGGLPSPKEIRAGFAPQLPLLGAMVEQGAFDPEGGGGRVVELSHVKLSGGVEKPGETKRIENPEEAIRSAFEGLTELATRFQDPEVGYLSMPHPRFRLRYGDYDHLARVREWALVEEGDE